MAIHWWYPKRRNNGWPSCHRNPGQRCLMVPAAVIAASIGSIVLARIAVCAVITHLCLCFRLCCLYCYRLCCHCCLTFDTVSSVPLPLQRDNSPTPHSRNGLASKPVAFNCMAANCSVSSNITHSALPSDVLMPDLARCGRSAAQVGSTFRDQGFHCVSS